MIINQNTLAIRRAFLNLQKDFMKNSTPNKLPQLVTARKVSKYGVFSGPYFPVFRLNTEKYGPEKTPYLDTFDAVGTTEFLSKIYSLNTLIFV